MITTLPLPRRDMTQGFRAHHAPDTPADGSSRASHLVFPTSSTVNAWF